MLVRKILLAVLFIFFCPGSAIADHDAPPVAGLGIPARVISVYDGDTLTVEAWPWPGQSIETRIRLDGIDTPEIRGRCPEEIAQAKAARDRLAELAGDRVYLQNIRPGYYAGRMVARVYTAAGDDIAPVLIAENYGRPWAGHRESWCAP